MTRRGLAILAAVGAIGVVAAAGLWRAAPVPADPEAHRREQARRQVEALQRLGYLEAPEAAGPQP